MYSWKIVNKYIIQKFPTARTRHNNATMTSKWRSDVVFTSTMTLLLHVYLTCLVRKSFKLSDFASVMIDEVAYSQRNYCSQCKTTSSQGVLKKGRVPEKHMIKTRLSVTRPLKYYTSNKGLHVQQSGHACDISWCSYMDSWWQNMHNNTQDIHNCTYSEHNLQSVVSHDFLADTLRNNDVVVTSKRRPFDVITPKWHRFDTIML